MTARSLIVPGAMPSRDRNGRALAAKLRFYLPNTTTPATVYTSSALNVAHPFPILSDSAGRWPAIWADDANSFDAAWSDLLNDRLIASFSALSPANDAVLASADMAQGSADAAAASAALAATNATQDNAIASAASAAAAATSATLANDWATKTSGEVVTGQGYGAKKYSQDAAASATAASGSATAAASSAAAAHTSELNAAAIVGFNPTAVHVTGGGLATGGGDITADRTITVTKSSQAQAQAGSDDTTAMTPARVADAIAALTASVALPMFGDGSDGNVTVSGAVTLSRDMFYANLTLAAGAAISTAGYRIFVSGTLDLTAAPAGAIKNNGANGSQGTDSTSALPNAGGSGGSSTPGVTVGAGGAGASGALGQDVSGSAGASGGSGQNGGAGGPGGAGGAGSGGSGGAGGAAGGATATVPHFVRTSLTSSDQSTTLLNAGAGGGSGGGGCGDGGATRDGGGGGGSGSGAGLVQIFARYINRGAGTAPGAIQAKGGAGARGGNVASGQAGGGGGGAGGGGGWVYVACQALQGVAATTAVDVSGGQAGNGGAGFGAAGVGGKAGGYGASGRFTLAQLAAVTVTDSGAGTAGAIVNNVGLTGGVAASAPVTQYSL